MKRSTSLRNALAALLLSTGIGLGLSSCGDANASLSETKAPRIATPVMHLEKPVLKTVETPEAAPALEETPDFQIELVEAVACETIENREPLYIGEGFSLDIDKVWIYSKVKLPEGTESSIQHVYYHEGKEIQTVDLTVKGPTYRTRSYKTIQTHMEGNWEVKVLDAKGNTLDTVEFMIHEEFYGGC